MGNKLERQMSMRKKSMDAMSRLDLLEAQADDVAKSLPNLARAVDQAIGQQSQDTKDLREYVDAIIGMLGVAAVEQAVADARVARMKAAAEGTKANIVKALEDGKLVKVEKIGEKTLIVGAETMADGTVIPPGYAAIAVTTVKKAYKEKLVGQVVGFQMETDGGGKFEVKELYESVEPPAEAPAASATPAEAAPAAEAPPAPAAPTEAPSAPAGT